MRITPEADAAATYDTRGAERWTITRGKEVPDLTGAGTLV